MPYKKSMDLSAPQYPTTFSKPIRILHVVGGMNRGGVETWLMHILRKIDQQQFQMDFLVHDDQHYAYTDEIKSLGSKIIICTGQSQPWLYASNFRKVLRYNEPYDIVHVHVHLFSGYILHLAKQSGIRVRIIHSHSDTSSIESKAKWQRKLYSYLMKWWIKRNATAGLAVSRLAASDLLGSSWENDSRWQILYCGVDLKPFCENIKASEVRAEFGISEDTFVVGHVGRFDFPKNHNFLVEIAYEIAKIEPNMCLLLIGVGSLRAEIEEKVNRMGLSEMVIFAGSRPDVPRLMKGVMNINKRIKDNLFSL